LRRARRKLTGILAGKRKKDENERKKETIYDAGFALH
jgi:hypothetical protein